MKPGTLLAVKRGRRAIISLPDADETQRLDEHEVVIVIDYSENAPSDNRLCWSSRFGMVWISWMSAANMTELKSERR